jgi:hypothetical protein
MLILHLRHVAPAGKAATRLYGLQQARRVSLYAALLGSGKGFRTKDSQLAEWIPLPLEAMKDVSPFWAYIKSRKNLSPSKRADAALSGEHQTVCTDEDLIMIPSPGTALLRHSQDGEVWPKDVDGNNAFGPPARIPRFYRGVVKTSQNHDSELGKEPGPKVKSGDFPKVLWASAESSRTLYWLKQMQLAYGFLEKGHIVEVHIVGHNKRTKKRDVAASIAMLHENPHLWPSVILRAMPIGTSAIMLPWTDGRRIVWAMTKYPDETKARVAKCLVGLNKLTPIGTLKVLKECLVAHQTRTSALPTEHMGIPARYFDPPPNVPVFTYGEHADVHLTAAMDRVMYGMVRCVSIGAVPMHKMPAPEFRQKPTEAEQERFRKLQPSQSSKPTGAYYGMNEYPLLDEGELSQREEGEVAKQHEKATEQEGQQPPKNLPAHKPETWAATSNQRMQANACPRTLKQNSRSQASKPGMQAQKRLALKPNPRLEAKQRKNKNKGPQQCPDHHGA